MALPSSECVNVTCERLPAVMFDIVQQASLRMDSLGDDSRWRRQGSAEQFKITCDGKKNARVRIINQTNVCKKRTKKKKTKKMKEDLDVEEAEGLRRKEREGEDEE